MSGLITDDPENIDPNAIYKVVYLGDGLYAKYDGFQVYLMADSHENQADIIALDSRAILMFERYLQEIKYLKEALSNGRRETDNKNGS